MFIPIGFVFERTNGYTQVFAPAKQLYMRKQRPFAAPLARVVAADGEEPAGRRSAGAALLADALESTPALIIVADFEGRIQISNQACECVTGLRQEEIIGRPLLDILVAPEARSVLGDRFTADFAARFRPPIMTIPLATRAGERRRIEWTFSAAARRCGTMRGILGIGIDITVRLADLNRARRHRADLARLMYREMFAAVATSLSHEVSQPLSAALA